MKPISVDVGSDENDLAHLRVLKVPMNIMTVKPFELTELLAGFTSEPDGLKPKRVSREQQYETVKQLVERPFEHPRTIFISSKPNDLRAKYLGAWLLLRACQVYRNQTQEYRRRRLLNPVWHTLTGSFQDKYRDNPTADRPAMMVLSNVLPSSSAVKLEKLRDLLELYSDIPRVVCLSDMDPLTFATQHLSYAVNGAVYLTSKRVIKEI